MNNLPALITAVATLFSTVVVCTLAILQQLRSRSRTTDTKVEQVHTTVNGRTTALMTYQAVLVELLNAAGLSVPPPPIDPAPDPGAATSQH